MIPDHSKPSVSEFPASSAESSENEAVVIATAGTEGDWKSIRFLPEDMPTGGEHISFRPLVKVSAFRLSKLVPNQAVRTPRAASIGVDAALRSSAATPVISALSSASSASGRPRCWS